MFIQDYPPYGAIPGSEVAYDMTTDMITIGISYTFKKITKENKDN
jgi:long-chain fatty acid transport protein